MSGGASDRDENDALRLDLWLWRARFHRTRSLAAAACARGVRVNGRRTDKPGTRVRVGDVLTLAVGDIARVVEVCALGERRGPAAEAQTLYRPLDRPG